MSNRHEPRYTQFHANSPARNLTTNLITKSMLPQPQQKANNKLSTSFKHQFTTANNLSDSETDMSTSTENLSVEQRYVLRHTPRVEPQGQETFQEVQNNSVETQCRNPSEQRYSSNISSDSTRYTSSNRSVSDPRTPVYTPQPNNSNSMSNRNSFKEMNSNRSSMDVSTCSYNTLIIHNDDSIYTIGNGDFANSSPISDKHPHRNYDEKEMQEITEIPDDYLNQSHVLKHLAKEIKLPIKGASNDNSSPVEIDCINPKEHSKFSCILEENENLVKTKSKSQPDLTKFTYSDTETIANLLKENASLKRQLRVCGTKVAKTQKLEDEVANIYRAYEELVQSCERREQLERVARMRLQENLQKVQTLNRALKDQIDIFQSQLSAPSEHQILIAQLFAQNKELLSAKERQDVELAAQQATLQEQRTHIGILDTALNNAQRNLRRLEEELRKKQMFIEKLTQICGANALKANERKLRLEYENDLSKDSNRSGSSTTSESKWHLQDKECHLRRLESEQRHLDEQAMRQNASKTSLDKTSQETDLIIAEAKHDKLRYLEEVQSAQRQVCELQAHLKGLESRLAEKDAHLRALQAQKICGSSFDSYNLSSDSYGINQLRYNTPPSFNVSNFNTNTNSSILEQTYASNTQHFNAGTTMGSITSGTHYGHPTVTYNQNALNLQSVSIPGNYSPSSSNYSASFDPNSNYTAQNSPTFNTYSNKYDEHISKQIDEQLNKLQTLQRGLCCFPGLNSKKANQPLLSDDISVLSTNNSDGYLQKLADYDQRERDRKDQDTQSIKNKAEDIILLEKQGKYSQRNRNGNTSNLVQVTQTVGQNMTDISHIGEPPTQNYNTLGLSPRKDRGSSLPPSALPRPPRSLKSPRKSDFEHLNGQDVKKRLETPPRTASRITRDVNSQTLRENRYSPEEYTVQNEFNPVKQKLTFGQKASIFASNDFQTTNPVGGMFTCSGESNKLSKPNFPSIKRYQRLYDKEVKTSSPTTEYGSLKRSFLPSAKKSPISNGNTNCNNPVNNVNNNGNINPNAMITTNNNPNSMRKPSVESSPNMKVRSNSNSKCNLNGTQEIVNVNGSTMASDNNNNNTTRAGSIYKIGPKSRRDSMNSSGSNNSNHSNANTQCFVTYMKSDINAVQRSHSKTPPKFLPNTLSPNNNNINRHPRMQINVKSALPVPSSNSSLPPKPSDNKNFRRSNSSSKSSENRYRIQF